MIAGFAWTSDMKSVPKMLAGTVQTLVADNISSDELEKVVPTGKHIDCIIVNPNTGQKDNEKTTLEGDTKIYMDVGPHDHHERNLQKKVDILERTDAEINQDCFNFVPPSYFVHAVELLNKHMCLVLLGASGDGKTTLGRALCRHFRDSEGHTPVVIEHPDDWRYFYGSSEQKLVFLDDLYGRFNFSIQNVCKWKESLLFKEGGLRNCKVIITSNLSFMNRGKTLTNDIENFSSDCILNLSESLDFDTKMGLLRMYRKPIENSDDSFWETLGLEDDIGFPLTCKVVLEQASVLADIHAGFRNPQGFMRKELSTIIGRSPVQCAIFFLLAKHGGLVNVKDKEVQDSWKTLKMRLSTGSKESMSEVCKMIPPCYVRSCRKENSTIHFAHPLVLLVALQVLWSLNQDLLLHVVSKELLTDLFVLENAVTSLERVIAIPHNREVDLAVLFTKVFVDGNCGVLFLNKSFSVLSFVKHFINCLSKNESLIKVLCKCDDLGLSPLQYGMMSDNAALIKQLIDLYPDNMSPVHLLSACCKAGNISALINVFSKFKPKQFLQSTDVSTLFLTALSWHQKSVVLHMMDMNTMASPEIVSSVVYYLLKKNDLKKVAIILSGINSRSRVSDLTSFTFPCKIHLRNCTLLTCLCERSDLDLVRQFCAYGANIEASNYTGNTPLTIAINNNNVSLLSMLISNHAQVNVANVEGETPLHRASLNGNLNTIAILLKSGSNLEAKTNTMKSPLDYACRKRNVEAARILLRAYKSLSNEREELQPIHKACILKSVDAVNLLLEDDDDPEQLSSRKRTPLHFACIGGNAKLVTLLVARNVDVNCVDTKGKTPLLLACDNDNFDEICILLGAGANVNISDVEGRSPLIAACSSGNIQLIDLLISEGSDVNKDDLSGHTPLHSACSGGWGGVVELLLQKNADVKKKTGNLHTALHIASGRADWTVVKALLNAGADVDDVDAEGRTPLHHAVLRRNTEVIRCLLENGAQLNKASFDGKTPLDLDKRLEILK